MVTKQQVIDLHVRNPDWTADALARELKCRVEYIRSCKRRYNLNIPQKTTRSVKPGIISLGRAARAAGLTVEMIQQMGA